MTNTNKTTRNNTFRILAKNHLQNNDSIRTHLNNNDLVIGPSGAGKTRGYVKPNILQANESMIIADTKGNLRREFTPFLKKKGYTVYDIDLIDALHSPCGYNPLDYVSYDSETESYSEADIRTLSANICPVLTTDDPFWELNAQLYLECLLAYIFECLPKEEHTLETASRMFRIMNTRMFDSMFKELTELKPECHAVKMYEQIRGNRIADKTDSCVRAFLGEHLAAFTFNGCEHFYNSEHKLHFPEIGQHKTAVFLTISDHDRSRDGLANLFYTQALQSLIDSADHNYPNEQLTFPVRFILDDFATNTIIPDFNNIISVIRSREIYVSLIIQSLSQLYSLYGVDNANIIIANCDNWLYLGGQDVATAKYLSEASNKPLHTILYMGLTDAMLFTRGTPPCLVEKYDFTKHPDYSTLKRDLKTVTETTDSAIVFDDAEELPFL